MTGLHKLASFPGLHHVQLLIYSVCKMQYTEGERRVDLVTCGDVNVRYIEGKHTGGGAQ